MVKHAINPIFWKKIEDKKDPFDLISWRAFAYFLSGKFLKCHRDLYIVLSEHSEHQIATNTYLKILEFSASTIGLLDIFMIGDYF